VRALLLDLDDTLLDYSGRAEACWTESCLAVAAPAGVDPAALGRALEDVRGWFWSDPERHRAERTDMVGAWTKIAALGLTRLGAPADGLARRIAEDFAARRCAAERLFPEALATLGWLRARGVPLGLVTNGDARLQREKIARHGLQPFFGVVVIEGEFGCGKPDARVFRHALGALGAAPGGAWMVGDHLDWDVDGAQRVGLGAVWIDRAHAGLPAASPCRPDRIIHALDELRDLAS
jgi:putative hydrolase of the HAD superfamily